GLPYSRLIMIALLVAHGALLAIGAFRQAPTVDEPTHLVAGLDALHRGRFRLNPGNPPLVGVVAALPVTRALGDLDAGRRDALLASPDRFLAEVGSRAPRLVGLGRLACLPFGLLGAWVCWRWARDLDGEVAGLLALLLWATCPNLLGHGSLITADVAATAL